MTIYNPGDKVVRREVPEGLVYTIEERTGDQYRVTEGEGDTMRTLFYRGYELAAPPSNDVEKPEETPAPVDVVEPPPELADQDEPEPEPEPQPEPPARRGLFR